MYVFDYGYDFCRSCTKKVLTCLYYYNTYFRFGTMLWLPDISRVKNINLVLVLKLFKNNLISL